MDYTGQTLTVSIADLRNRISHRFLPLFVVGLWLVVFMIPERLAVTGFHPIYVIQFSIAVLTTVIWLLRRTLKSEVLEMALVLILAVLFFQGILTFGLLAPAMLLPPSVSLFLMLLGHKRAAYMSIAVVAGFLSIVAYLYVNELLTPLIEPRAFIHSSTEWSFSILVVTVISTMFVVPFRLMPETLESSEQRFHIAFENANEGVCLVGTTGRFLEVNKAFCEILGFRREELLHMGINDVTHPDDIRNGEDFIAAALSGKSERGSFEKRYLDKHGNEVWVRVSTSLVRETTGQPQYFISHIQDISDRRLAEQRLIESEERFRGIFDSVNDAIFIHDLDNGTILDVNQKMCQMFGYTREEARLLNVEDLSLGRFPYNRDSALQWMKKAAQGMEQIFEWRSKTKSGRLFWSEVNMRRATIGDQERIVVSVRDIDDRKLAAAALVQSENKYHTLFNSASDSIFLMRQGVFVDCNARTLEMFGVEAGQILQHRPEEFSPLQQRDGGSSQEQASQKIKSALEGTPQLFEWQHKRLDGTLFDAEVSLNRLELSEGSPDLLAIVRDITERKKEERALRESEERFQKVFHASPAPMSISRLRDGAYVDVNDSFLRAMEYDRKEIIGRTAVDLETWSNPEERKEVVKILQHEGSLRNFEGQHRTKSGKIGYSVVSAEVIELNGESFILGVTLDITERKLAEEALRASEEKFAKVFKSTPAGISLTRLSDGCIIESNAEFENLFGYSHEETIGRSSIELKMWKDPRDRDTLLQLIEDGGEIKDYELRLQKRDGSELIVRYNGQLIELGRERFLLSAFLDVTDRKRGEDQLLQSEARYRALVENTPDIIARFDLAGRYLFVNSAIATVSPLKPSEFTGKTVWEVGFSNEQAEERESLLQKVVETGKGIEAELGFKTPSGNRLYEWRGYPEFGKDGRVQSVLTMNRDITDRKRAEQDLKTSMEQLHSLTQRLEQIREEERKAISHEVHDELGQVLTALRMDLMSIKTINPAKAIEFEEKIKGAIDLTDNAIENVQQIAARLRPGMLDYLGLLAAVEWQMEEFQKRSGVQCTLQRPEREPSIDNERATALFRILQETLTNVARHAHAKKVKVILSESPSELTMTIADDGVGITKAQIEDPKSLGLLGMRERLHPFQGICTIGSPPGGGTTVTVNLPTQQHKS